MRRILTLQQRESLQCLLSFSRNHAGGCQGAGDKCANRTADKSHRQMRREDTEPGGKGGAGQTVPVVKQLRSLPNQRSRATSHQRLQHFRSSLLKRGEVLGSRGF